jgi:phosphoglycerol transferase
MNVSLDGIVNAAAKELGRDLKGYKIETNLLGPRYDAELSDGIVFSRDGEPRFIKSFSGISGREDFGRWTDGNEVVIEFMRPLPKMFTLRIKAGTSTSLVGVPFDIHVGEFQAQAKFIDQAATDIEIAIATNGSPSSIVFRFKNIKSPMDSGQGSDTRRLGLALVSLHVD